MKVDVSKPITQLDGTVIKDGSDENAKALTIKTVISSALLQQKDSEKVSLSEAIEKNSLAEKIYAVEKEVELSLDEVEKVRKALGASVFFPRIKALCGNALEEAAKTTKH